MFSRIYVLKIFILAMVMLMVMTISAVSAREAAYNFNTHTPGNSALRSLMLPGWGQFFNEQPTKGLIFAGAELIALGTAFMTYSSADSTYSDYETQRTAALYDDYSSKIDTANMFVYAAAAIWVGNVIDAYLSADNKPAPKSKKSSALKKNSKKKKKVEVEEIEEEPAEDEEEIQEEETEEQEEQVKPRKKQKKQIKEEIEEEEEEETEEEEEEDESRLPGTGFYLQAKGLNQLGIAYRYTF
ncbi:MAG: DUF5683 domain-containing protein [bacterium]|nr:DUF5683 domain-containing protein [bacterium]